MCRADSPDPGRGKRKRQVALFDNDVVVPKRVPLLELHVPTSLDSWLADPHVRIRYARTSQASPDELWDAAMQIRLRDTRTMGRLIRWRLGRHTPSADTTYRDLFRTGIFTLLEDGERLSISGVAGRIWAPSGDYARFESTAEYREWSKPGTAKVVFLTEVHEHERGSEIVSEARVRVEGRRARMLFRGLWSVVGRFAWLVGGEVLAAAVKRAETRS